MTNFRLFQTDRVCSDNFKFDENCRKFSKLVENTAGKGEIARYEQLLVFLQCFQKTCTVKTRACLGKDYDVLNYKRSTFCQLIKAYCH